MHFEARELKLSSEPVKTAALVEGAAYFSVSYADQDRLIPILQPYIFEGKDPDAPPHLFDYEQALNELMVCSMRRRGIALDAHPLQFEAREVKRFPEPVKGEDLQEGNVYFSVFFVDEEFLVPGLEPYVFVGRDLDAEEAGLYFQDMDSYGRGIRYGVDTGGRRATLVIDSDDNLNHFDYGEALEQLLACSLRRRKRAGRL